MTVICPSCDSRFRDPPADIPKSRPMQCSNCDYEWVLGQEPLSQVDAPSMAPQMSDLLENGEDAILTNLPVVIEGAEDDTVKRDPIYVDKLPTPKPRKSRITLMSLAALIGIGAVTGSIVMRDTVMEKAPQTVALYDAAGLISVAPGLEIENVVTTRTKEDGIRRLIVRGEIENVASNTVPVPPIKLIMRNKSDAHLYAWTVTAAKPSLKAGERSRFTAVAQDYPGDAVNVEVEFVPAK